MLAELDISPARPTPRRRSSRAWLVAVATAVLALVMTGCIKVDMNMTLHEDDTMDGVVVFAVQDAVATQVGMTPQQLWDQFGAELAEDWPAGTTEEPYAEGGYTGSRLHFPAQPIMSVHDVTGQPLEIVRRDDEFYISGDLDMNQLSQEEGLDQQLIQDMDVQISITCPGRIIESNGTARGNTVTWTPTPAGLNQFTARCAALADMAPADIGEQAAAGEATVGLSGNEPIPTWIPALGIAFLVGLGLLAWLLWHRSHRREATEHLGLDQFDAHHEHTYPYAADYHEGYVDAYGNPVQHVGYHTPGQQ